MATGGKRKTKHELTDQEIEYYKELSTALYNIRSASGRSVPEMAKRCGYSEVHLRKLENFDLENVSPVPAYIVAVYAEACNVKMDDFCEGWFKKMSKKPKKEVHSRKIKYITIGENDLLQRMRTFRVIGSCRIAQLLGDLTRQDLETIYCLKKIEEKLGAPIGYYIGKNIRHMIYQFYMQIGGDAESGRENIKRV